MTIAWSLGCRGNDRPGVELIEQRRRLAEKADKLQRIEAVWRKGDPCAGEEFDQKRKNVNESTRQEFAFLRWLFLLRELITPLGSTLCKDNISFCRWSVEQIAKRMFLHEMGEQLAVAEVFDVFKYVLTACFPLH
jgi:hypothetical protein